MPSIKDAHRGKVLDLLCESSTRGEKSVPLAAMINARDSTKAAFMAVGESSEEATRQIQLAEQEAINMYPSECKKRISVATTGKSGAGSIAGSFQSETSAAPAAGTPNEKASTAPVLPEPIDEHDFIASPYFSNLNPLHNSLKKLDASYRCSICRDLYTNPVAVLHCLHTFCSECIRKHCKICMTKNMRRECHCPECNGFIGNSEKNYESNLKANHHFANQVENYKQMREDLRSSLARLSVLERERSSALTGGASDVAEGERKHNVEEIETSSSNRSTRRAAKRTKYIDDSSEGDSDNDSDFKMVEPESTQQNKSKITLIRKTMITYHGMKRKNLVELCRKEGLSTKGNDDDLKKRHSDFITLYNSECDAEHPRSVDQLIQEIKKREIGLKREVSLAMQNGSQRHGSYMNKLKQNVEIRGKGGNAPLTSGDAQFDAKISDNFRNLIKKARMGKENNSSMENSSGNLANAADEPVLTSGNESAGSANMSATEPIDESSPSLARPEIREVLPSQSALPAKQLSSTPKPARQRKKKSPSTQQVPSRIVDAGPWKCSRCTYNNERNTTAKALCEMCCAPRKEAAIKRQDVEVIDVDC